MEEEYSTRTEILEAIGIHLITSLFTETLLDIIKNTCSSSSTSSSSDKELQTYLYSTIQTVQNTPYLIPWEIFPKSTAIIDICLNINKYKKPREFR